MKSTSVLLLLALCASAHAGITLVRESQPQAVIIVPDGLGKAVHLPATRLTAEAHPVPLAAVELADYIGKITSVRPPIRTESARDANLPARAAELDQ